MKYSRLTDRDLILSVLMDKDIQETTAIDKVELEINTKKNCFLGCFKDGHLIGVCVFEPDNSVCVNYHPNLLKKYRGELSVPFTIGALKWLINKAPMYQKVNAKFPVKYKGLSKYAENCGFKNEGLDRSSCSLGDRHSYGITKEEIKKL